MGVATVALVYDLVRRPLRPHGRVRRPGSCSRSRRSASRSRATTTRTRCSCSASSPRCGARVRALEDGRTRWLVLAGVAVGLGFETKMAAALLVVPGDRGRVPVGRAARPRCAVAQLLGGGAAMVVVGGAWPLLVALTPAAVAALGVGHERQQHRLADPRLQRARPALAARPAVRSGVGGGGGGGGVFGGDAGVWRLLERRASAARPAGCSASRSSAASRCSPPRGCGAPTRAPAGSSPSAARSLTTAVAFSSAEGIFHPYYVSALAPFTARARRRRRRRSSPASAGPRACSPRPRSSPAWRPSWRSLAGCPGSSTVIAPVMAVAVRARGGGARRRGHRARPHGGARRRARGAAAGARRPGRRRRSATRRAARSPPAGPHGEFGGGGGLAAAGGGSSGGGTRHRQRRRPERRAVTEAGSAAAPATLGSGGSPDGARSGGGMFGGDSSLTAAAAYAAANGGGTIAVVEPVRRRERGARRPASTSRRIGGFSGRESEVSTDWLAERVAAGAIRWVLADGSSGGMPQDGRTGATEVMAAVEADVHAGLGRRRALRLLRRRGGVRRGGDRSVASRGGRPPARQRLDLAIRVKAQRIAHVRRARRSP